MVAKVILELRPPKFCLAPTFAHREQRRLHRPLEKNLEDKILRGEYIDFTLLLPDSIAHPQSPEVQLRVEDSAPGSLVAPVT